MTGSTAGRIRPVYVNTVTPSLDAPMLAAAAHSIKPGSVPVQVKMSGRLKPMGNCYWNVAQVVGESGGQMQLGWIFFTLPGIFVEAMHHAVWKMPDGRLIDVTAKYPTDPNRSHSVFLPDNSFRIDLERQPNILSKHAHIDHPEVVAHIAAYRELHKANTELAELAWAMGYRCEQQFALAAGGNIPPLAIEVSSLKFQSALRSVQAAKASLGEWIDVINNLAKKVG